MISLQFKTIHHSFTQFCVLKLSLWKSGEIFDRITALNTSKFWLVSYEILRISFADVDKVRVAHVFKGRSKNTKHYQKFSQRWNQQWQVTFSWIPFLRKTFWVLLMFIFICFFFKITWFSSFEFFFQAWTFSLKT